MQRKLSVVIPVYNGEKFIGRALESVFSQTVPPDEIIVVNDGSRDGTAQKLAEFGDRIQVISIPNGGVANARNVGLKACTGDLIALLDADDIWYPDKLEKQLAVMQRYPAIGFCCCNYRVLDQSRGEMVGHFSSFSRDPDYNFDAPLKQPALELLIRSNFVGTCSNVMFRRALIDQVGDFKRELKQAEDYELWIRFSMVTNFVLMSDQLLEKVTHDTNLTNDFYETMRFHEQVLLTIRNDVLSAGTGLVGLERKFREALADTRYRIGNGAYEARQILRAFGYYFRGLVTIWTFRNVGAFLYHFSRKLIRTVSFGLVRNRA